MIDTRLDLELLRQIAKLEKDVADLEGQEVGATGTIIVEDEGSLLGAVGNLDYRGDGVSAGVVGDVATITIPGTGSASWELIESKSIASEVSQITFSGISSNFTNLLLMFDLLSTTNGALLFEWVTGFFNNDQGTTKYETMKFERFATLACSAVLGGFYVAAIPADFSDDDYFGVGWLHAAGYKNTDTFKSCLSQGSYMSHDDSITVNPHGHLSQASGVYESKDAINRIDLILEGSGNFAVGCELQLYGMD